MQKKKVMAQSNIPETSLPLHKVYRSTNYHNYHFCGRRVSECLSFCESDWFLLSSFQFPVSTVVTDPKYLLNFNMTI